MRLLADENFPQPTIESPEMLGHDVFWARTHFREWKDVDVLELAEAEGHILLTFDKDFLQLTRQRRSPIAAGAVILFRVHRATPLALEPLIRAIDQDRRSWAGVSTL